MSEKQNFSMSMEKYFTSECSEQLKCFLLAKGTWYTLYTTIIHVIFACEGEDNMFFSRVKILFSRLILCKLSLSTKRLQK